MNVYEALRIYLDNSDLYGALTKDELNARTKLESTVIAYDTLEPDWSNAPEWSQWYFINLDCAGLWCDGEPGMYDDAIKFDLRNVDRTQFDTYVTLPLGIDWRLCKWQRPEVING